LPALADAFARDRRGGQLGLATLMLLALGAVLVARLAGAPSPALVADPSASATARPTASPSGAPAGTMEPTARPTASVPPSTPGSTSSPVPATPEPVPTTYTVRPGDTLVGIAARFGTTVAALAELNGITDPGRIRPGQVLRLP
jgi:LysM repeat protein